MKKRRIVRLKKPELNLSGTRTVRLSISVGIFLALALIKLFDPNGASRMSGAVDEYIGDRTPVTIEALGKAISSGDSLIAVFHNLSEVLTGKIQEPNDTEAVNTDEPDIPSDADVTDQSDSATSTSSPTPDPFLSASAYQTSELISRSMPWRGDIENVSEDELLSGGDFGVDDTLPLPFGYDAPPNVDYTEYEFGFDYSKPISGVGSSGFGYRLHPIKKEILFHYGTDIAANKGTEISAFAAGKVTTIGYNKTYGNYLMIEHKDSVSSFYAHCSKILVKKNATVKMGQAVAKVGSTGLSTGPHLHFELRRDGKILDPEYYL